MGLVSVKKRRKRSGDAGHREELHDGEERGTEPLDIGKGVPSHLTGERGACLTSSPASSPIPPNTEGHDSILRVRGSPGHEKPRTKPKESRIRTERTGTEKIGSYSVLVPQEPKFPVNCRLTEKRTEPSTHQAQHG
jgi:hypothetical protein